MRAIFDKIIEKDLERRKEMYEAIGVAVHNAVGEAMSKVFR